MQITAQLSLSPIVNAFTESDERLSALHKEGRENIVAEKT